MPEPVAGMYGGGIELTFGVAGADVGVVGVTGRGVEGAKVTPPFSLVENPLHEVGSGPQTLIWVPE